MSVAPIPIQSRHPPEDFSNIFTLRLNLFTIIFVSLERVYFRLWRLGAALKLMPFSVKARAVAITESCLSR